jgi:hypothetical protein
MKDNQYLELLKEVTNRVLTKHGWNWNSGINEEMEYAKKILLSSGHDLDDIKDFNEEVNRKVSDYLSGLSI